MVINMERMITFTEEKMTKDKLICDCGRKLIVTRDKNKNKLSLFKCGLCGSEYYDEQEL